MPEDLKTRKFKKLDNLEKSVYQSSSASACVVYFGSTLTMQASSSLPSLHPLDPEIKFATINPSGELGTIPGLPVPVPVNLARAEGMSCIKCRKRQRSPTDLVVCTSMKTSKRFKNNPRPCVNKYCVRCAQAFDILPHELIARQWKCARCSGKHVQRAKKKKKVRRASVLVSEDLSNILSTETNGVKNTTITFPRMQVKVDLNGSKVETWIKRNIENQDLSLQNRADETKSGESTTLKMIERMNQVQARVNDCGDKAPPEFLCPLTRRIMVDPVLWVEDCRSYERSALDEKIDEKTDMITAMFSEDKQYFPNTNLRRCIESWKKKNGPRMHDSLKKANVNPV